MLLRKPNFKTLSLITAITFSILTVLVVYTAYNNNHPVVKKEPIQSGHDDDEQQQQQPHPPIHITHYNRHHGVRENLNWILTHLNLTTHLSLVSPHAFVDLGKMTNEKAHRTKDSNIIKYLCDTSDVIVTGDTLPDARPLLLQVQEDECNAKVVIELTNRFDWEISDEEGYFDLIRDLVGNKGGKYDGKLYWVVNNPWEDRYLYLRTGAWIGGDQVRLIRPVGYSSVKPDNDKHPSSNPTKSYIPNLDDNLRDLLIMHDISFEHFGYGYHYGGPQGLKTNYKTYLEVAYQASTMKMYENLAAGVVQLAPSAKLFEELARNGTIWFWPWDVMNTEKNWTQYVEVYNPLFEPYYYYFDSFSELSTILKTKTVDEIDSTKQVRKKGPEFYKQMRRKSVNDWGQLFRDMGFYWVQSDL
ncbi:hypothetical protein HDU76_007049 [Blyttiomyces sp. JEL0837]|nr:hypothetical protein HDU76_007049 [Blyttiomyces sp. JEL0837]